MKHPKDADLVAHDVLPLFILETGSDLPRLLEFTGSAFLIAPHVIVTCHHCVGKELSAGTPYASLYPSVDGYGAAQLENITHYPEGFDLISANVDVV